MKTMPYPLSGTRVLVVEDEYYLADDLARALQEAGAEIVGPAGSLEDAEHQVAGRHFDCAILDMNLRGDMTFALADRLREADVPFVIATGYGGSAIPQSLRDVPRVEKPYTIAQLIDIIGSLPKPATSRA